MIPHNQPQVGQEEAIRLQEVLLSRQLSQGPEVERFEEEFCSYVGLPECHAVALSSCTAALFLALHVLGLRGKKITFPVYVCSSLRHAVGMAGAEEDLCDVQNFFPQADLSNVPEGDALIQPHLFGRAAPIPKDFKGAVIEDCAQAIGATRHGDCVGTIGTIGVYSFYATKMMTSGGQGGMLVSRDRALVDNARDFREFDGRRDRKKRFNFQMTDLQAAVGRVQLSKLNSFCMRREQIFQKYREAGIPLLDVEEKGCEPVRYRALFSCTQPEGFCRHMAAHGISCILPLKKWELLGPADQFPKAARWSQTLVSLPCYPSLKDTDVNKVIEGFHAWKGDAL